MADKIVRVTFGTDGRATIKTSGFAGRECYTATEAIEKAIGVSVSDQPTAEARNEPQRAVQTTTVRRG